MEMQNARPNVKLVSIQGTGHFVHSEKPKEFSEALQNFISLNED